MALSYSFRVICVIGILLGPLQIGVELLLRMGAPMLLRVVQCLPLRRQERALYFIQLVPVFSSLSLTAIFFVPQYVANETNFAPEQVSRLCVLVAIGSYTWWISKLVGGVQMAIRTMLFGRACRLRAGGSVPVLDATPMIAIAGETPRIALVGLLRPFIFISKSLTEEGGLDPLALQVVLSHERSHATHYDNWKLLSLYCLPRLDLRLADGKTWMQTWQSIAECAADEDAVEGSSARAFLLAETLVALARTPSAGAGRMVCTNLICEESELAVRVERLLHRTPGLPFGQVYGVYKMDMVLCLLALGTAGSLAALSSALRHLPERLLHLG